MRCALVSIRSEIIIIIFPDEELFGFYLVYSKFPLKNSGIQATIIKWPSILVQDIFSKFSQNLTYILVIHHSKPHKYNFMWLLADPPALLG